MRFLPTDMVGPLLNHFHTSKICALFALRGYTACQYSDFPVRSKIVEMYGLVQTPFCDDLDLNLQRRPDTELLNKVQVSADAKDEEQGLNLDGKVQVLKLLQILGAGYGHLCRYNCQVNPPPSLFYSTNRTVLLKQHDCNLQVSDSLFSYKFAEGQDYYALQSSRTSANEPHKPRSASMWD